MKNRFLILGIVLFLFPILLGADSQRQVKDYVELTNSIPQQVKSSSGQVFGITAMASGTNGWIAVYDVISSTSVTASLEPLIEIGQATQWNTAVKDWPEGLNFYNGIYAEGTNVKAVVYYY